MISSYQNFVYPGCMHWNNHWYYDWFYCQYCHFFQRAYCQGLRAGQNTPLHQMGRNSDNQSLHQAQQSTFTIEELAQYDGAEGRPAYVAVKGIVYDVSREATWGGGTHFGLYAGKDLTNQFEGCHGMEVILARLSRVGVLITPQEVSLNDGSE